MSLILKAYFHPDGMYGIWKNTVSDTFYLSNLDIYPEESDELATLKARKKTEWLSSRYLLHLLSENTQRNPCLKDAFGKPYLSDSKDFISISHSGDLTAVIQSSAPVGIDIQLIVQKIERIAGKFIRDDEFLFIPYAQRILYYQAIWGAKEAMYKAYGKKELDFRKHIRVFPFLFTEEGFHFEGCIEKDTFHEKYTLFCKLIDPYILVYAIQQ